MIAHLRGVLVERELDRVVVEAGGVGYEALVSLHTLAALPEVGREVFLRTHLQVREDAHLLFGFATDEERRAFELCLTISGIGPKLALALLSTLRPADLAAAVRDGDVKRLSSTPGVGKRTAERIVVELKDRVDRLGLAAPGPSRPAATGAAARAPAGPASPVASALVHLGYRPDEAERAATEALAAAAGGDATPPIEDLVRDALRRLASA